jgi:hypothetical protein
MMIGRSEMLSRVISKDLEKKLEWRNGKTGGRPLLGSLHTHHSFLCQDSPSHIFLTRHQPCLLLYMMKPCCGTLIFVRIFILVVLQRV